MVGVAAAGATAARTGAAPQTLERGLARARRVEQVAEVAQLRAQLALAVLALHADRRDHLRRAGARVRTARAARSRLAARRPRRARGARPWPPARILAQALAQAQRAPRGELGLGSGEGLGAGLDGAHEAHVLLQLGEAAVLAVGHQVDVRGALGAHGVRRLLHLERPAGRHDADDLRAPPRCA
jgi:hypothetical protein